MEIESVVVPTIAVVGVWLVGSTCCSQLMLSYLGVVLQRLESVAAWTHAVSFAVAVEIAHGRSFDASVEFA